MKWLYELIYRIVQLFNLDIARVFGPHAILEQLVLSLELPPGRAIDLGCGNGRDVIFLARHGFEAVGVDFSPTAIRLARQNAEEAGVQVAFVQDDLTDLRHVTGTFDLLLDYGAINDLNDEARNRYMENVLPLTRVGSRYILMCFDKKLGSEEVERRFGDHFHIEVPRDVRGEPIPSGIGLYVMTKRSSEAAV